MTIDRLKQLHACNYYRLFVDGTLHEREHGWLSYELREPGCIKGLFEAFEYALSDHLDDANISVDLLKNIHRRVTTPINLPGLESGLFFPGQLRTRATAFCLLQDSAPYGYCNEAGLRELIDFVNRYKAESAALYTLPMGVEAYNQLMGAQRLAIDTNSQDDSINIALDQLKEKGWRFRPVLEQNLATILASICSKFNRDIRDAKTDDEKLTVIVKCVQEIERIHGFSDGNGRTSYILLQRLLFQNGFSFTMMKDPNHIDGHDFRSVVEEVRQGMIYFEQLVDDPGATVFNYKTETVDQLRKYINPYRENDPVRAAIASYAPAEIKLAAFISSLIQPTASHAADESADKPADDALDEDESADKPGLSP